jgi:hypothetical protein
MPVTSYSRTPSNNNAAPPNGAPEGWAPSDVNNTVRQLMTDTVNEAAKAQASVLGSVAGTNTVTGGLSPALDAYTAGMRVVFTPANSNTAATTLNIDSLGALDIQKFNGAALDAGDLVAGIPALLVLDSGADDWILVNPQQIGLPGRTITGSDSTVAADNAHLISYAGTGGHTLTLDADIQGAGLVSGWNIGSGSLTIAASSSLTWLNGSGALSTGSRTLVVGGFFTARHVNSGVYHIWGTGLS